MLALRQLPGWGSMTDKQFLDYHFLLGYGALGSGKPETAMQALEWFLVRGPADPRRGLGYVLLGQCYMAQQRYVEARAAAVEVRGHYMPELDEPARRSAIVLYASSGLALGDRDEAFRDLEVLVQRQADPELALYLVDALIADKQYQWAIAIVGRTLEAREDSYGDAGRFRKLEAMFEQGMAAHNLADFPSPAITLALKIRSPELRSSCAELIGKAYEELGKPEHAADAYRGILR
jgi:tetratricopeptide (TPR) repeat protein